MVDTTCEVWSLLLIGGGDERRKRVTREENGCREKKMGADRRKWVLREEKWVPRAKKWVPRQRIVLWGHCIIGCLGTFGKFPLYYSKKRMATHRYRNLLRGALGPQHFYNWRGRGQG